jgi:hypothetical protein
MNNPTISDPALRLVEMLHASPVLRSMVEDRPDLLVVFIQAAEVAVKMSTDRGRLIAAVTRAADASDSVVEAIQVGNDVELAARLLLAGSAIQALGEALQEFSPKAVAMSRDSGAASN